MINKNEKGFALVLSLVLLLVMSLMGGALIVISSGDHQSNNNSDQYQQAFYVAETGLLEAEKAIINKYMGPYVEVASLSPVTDPGATATLEEQDEYNDWLAYEKKLEEEGVDTIDTSGNSIKTVHERDVQNRGMPRNETDIIETDCFLSFKNLDKTVEKIIADTDDEGEPITDDEGTITTSTIIEPLKVTGQARNQRFYDLIFPIFNDATKVDALANAEQIQKEEDFLKRFRYEFFSINAGTATYYGSGSSIKKKSSDSQSQGTAYKIYACGIMTKSESSDVAEIIIPLESLIVMPN